jgi:exosome complex RNA-binding protein Csl4
MMSKFNFRKTKYGLPLVLLPFLFLGAYVVSDIFPPEEKKSAAETKFIEGLNSILPDPAVPNQKDKFTLLQELLDRRKKHSGLQSLDNLLKELGNEEETFDLHSFLDPVTDTVLIDKNVIDREAESALRELQKKYFPDRSDFFGEAENKERQPANAQSEDLNLLRQQIAKLESILLAQAQESKEKPGPEQPDDVILIAKKANELQSASFNTIAADRKKMFITAILDEAQTVVNGSRIRIRLLDDIFIGNHLFKKGSYLYGLVSGFSAQRVHVDISTILYGDMILKTGLTIYDDDGIKGLYVPNSDFRDMMKIAGSRMAQSGNVNINSSQNAYQQFMSQMGQDFYRSATQAVSQRIRQNKAKLKYSSIIYLINEEPSKQ